MTLELKLRRVGNSLGVVLPKEALAQLNVVLGLVSPEQAVVVKELTANPRRKWRLLVLVLVLDLDWIGFGFDFQPCFWRVRNRTAVERVAQPDDLADS